MKKILYVNGGMKKFGDDFRNICSQSKIDCISFRAGINMAIHIENSKVDLYVDNNLINFDEIGYSFIRVKGKYTQPTALLSTLLKLKGIPFNDSSNTENTFNDEKVMQMLLFGHAGIPIPRTTIFTKESFEMNEKIILSKHTFPVVLKTSGSKGNAVWRVEKIEDIKRILGTKVPEYYSAIMQEYVKNTHDIRALYFEGKLIKAIERYSTDGFYNNVAKGGKTEETLITEEENEVCVKALEVLNLDFGGIDFLRTDRGLIFFEINKGPVIYGLEEVTGINVPKILIEKISNKYLSS